VRFIPGSLFARTAITIAVTLLVFMIISTTAALYFIYVPMAQRHADDFAAEIVSAAHSLQELPEESHEDLKRELLLDHGLIVTEQQGPVREQPADLPFHPFFKASLRRQAGSDLPIFDSGTGPIIWIDVPAHGRMFRLGFDRERLGINPPIVVLFVIVGGAALTLAASLMEVRRVVQPLERLSAAAGKVGRGLVPEPVPEDGPAEIAELARAFNQMTFDLQQMSENRTVMISGISHDLRTPLTRMALAIEMLDDPVNAELVARIRRDLDAMNKLIGQFLQFSRGIEDECPAQLDLRQVLDALVTDLRREGADLRLHRNDPPCVYYADPVALERVLTNLLQNAVQYGNSQPIDVDLRCSETGVSIEIGDRGPGIPPEVVASVFRPFHRLEAARSQRTGGSGLGLAIARQLAIKHGWTIELLPRDGGGTLARLGLPTANRFGLQVSSCAA
jgi:two-component system osmolarity sensor histidine kinase EnvZ